MTSLFAGKVALHDIAIGVVGMGYVGLPLALRFVECGFDVTGFDIDAAKVEALHGGRSYIKTIPHERVAKARRKPNGLHATSDFDLIRDMDAVILCVPTPLGRNREPDMTYVVNTARSIGPHMARGQLIVLESTTYPGTTDELLAPILDKESGMVAGKDYGLAYSPEREDPGNQEYQTGNIPKVVGGLTPACLEAAAALYGAALDKVVPVRDVRVAEMTKLLENIFRSVNIALVNELKMLCDAMGIDVWEVIEAAKTKPFGFMPFYPGPGLGGHCIPIDPFYLTWKAREYDLSTRFIELAGEVNIAMPKYVLDRLAWALNEEEISINGSSVLVIGVAYKRDVDDMREAPALQIIELLKNAGAFVNYHDPHVPKIVPTRHYDIQMTSLPLTAETIREQDACLIITDHTGVDYDLILGNAHLVIDTRNVMAGRSGLASTTVVKA